MNVVVGGASGMGKAVAEALVERGPLLIADNNLDAARAVAAGLGADVEAVECDVTDDAQIAALGARVDRLGSLVITAGVAPQMAPGVTILRVNLIGTAKLLDVFEPAVNPGSVVVCFASIAGHAMTPEPPVLDALDDPLAADLLPRLTELGVDVDDPNIAYVLSKLAIIRMVRRLAPASGARGGRILSLSPGVIDTSMGRRAVEALPRCRMPSKVGPYPGSARRTRSHRSWRSSAPTARRT